MAPKLRYKRTFDTPFASLFNLDTRIGLLRLSCPHGAPEWNDILTFLTLNQLPAVGLPLLQSRFRRVSTVRVRRCDAEREMDPRSGTA